MSPFTIADGVLGLEATHQWGAGLVLNQEGVYPRYELDRIGGLHSHPEVEDNREPAFGRIGEIAYPSLPRGKTLTYEGRVVAYTLAQMRAAAAALRGSFRPVSDGTMYVRPSPVIGGPTWRYGARVLACDVDDEQTRGDEAMPSPYQREFVLSLRMADPRFSVDGAPVSVNGVDGDVRVITNPGTAPADPVVVIDGPNTDDLVFERDNNPDAQKLIFSDVTCAAGDQLRLDWKARTLTRLSDGVQFANRVVFDPEEWWAADHRSWWDANTDGLNPGPTTIRVASTDGGAWVCTIDPASW